MVLTEKQRGDLHAAILDYLVNLGEDYAESATKFQEQSGLGTDDRPAS
ncbi:unnamed protein product, partial [Heterosigma akashiwo]